MEWKKRRGGEKKRGEGEERAGEQRERRKEGTGAERERDKKAFSSLSSSPRKTRHCEYTQLMRISGTFCALFKRAQNAQLLCILSIRPLLLRNSSVPPQKKFK